MEAQFVKIASLKSYAANGKFSRICSGVYYKRHIARLWPDDRALGVTVMKKAGLDMCRVLCFEYGLVCHLQKIAYVFDTTFATYMAF